MLETNKNHASINKSTSLSKNSLIFAKKESQLNVTVIIISSNQTRSCLYFYLIHFICLQINTWIFAGNGKYSNHFWKKYIKTSMKLVKFSSKLVKNMGNKRQTLNSILCTQNCFEDMIQFNRLIWLIFCKQITKIIKNKLINIHVIYVHMHKDKIIKY